MINCSFLPVFYAHHQCIKTGTPPADVKDFPIIENLWMGFYGLGKFETYQFIYENCTSITDLEEWIIRQKGEQQVRESAAAFDQWTKGKALHADAAPSILSPSQWQSWKEQGYLKVSNLVDEQLCDAVIQLICTQLGVDLSKPETWYNPHPDWHGLMLYIYQDERINAIKTLPSILYLFTELYGTSNIIANTEKVSFNPPETSTWTFRHSKLHWDIDFEKPDLDYIQGLVYLNDVPENRGPLTVVPGFHHRFKDWMKTYPDSLDAQQVMQSTLTGVPVPGVKGDIVLWRNTLPHAAGTNHADLPRFVQYISFSKC
ncbi:phytanoyl-CoA dioxygenase family protein [Dinghuibacter silviterrae]|uniref:Phytanoyl-CoA dioxygenase PhyH n=1 Tax=Dinghuibacter silviterrae TaxID=1539049 RepID=A0A4R8DQ73_9BACT|nr:phytanoyl-CoA dioxygenase family protein [Dinghuibacter silviterrae]TDW99917.1 phytanoyl-CoA dioxygenase PhyH [Dinghuibacter silviterrae]